MKSDIAIAQEAELKYIDEIRKNLGIKDDEFLPYGNYKGKISLDALERLKPNKNGKLIVVTAITPTKYGEGKTTTSIGLSMGLNRIGKNPLWRFGNRRWDLFSV